MIFSRKRNYWRIIKDKHSTVIKASCTFCNFSYTCGYVSLHADKKVVFKGFYNYCPMCGKKYKTDKYIADKSYIK